MKVNGKSMNKPTPAAVLTSAAQGAIRLATLPFYAVGLLCLGVVCAASFAIEALENKLMARLKPNLPADFMGRQAEMVKE